MGGICTIKEVNEMFGAVVAIGFMWWILSQNNDGETGDTPTPTPPVIPYAKFTTTMQIDCSTTQCKPTPGNSKWDWQAVEYQPEESNPEKLYIISNSSFTSFYSSTTPSDNSIKLTGAGGGKHSMVQTFNGSGDAGSKVGELYSSWLANNTPSQPPKVIDTKEPTTLEVEEVVVEVPIQENKSEQVIEVEEVVVAEEVETLKAPSGSFQNAGSYPAFKGAGLNV
tara:strand:- start:367 stop:1038 length:672 start_codon:yes stop_codon:yes gene_type:complete